MKNKFRVWHIPQLPMTPFHVYVKDVDEAILILNTLAEYDAFEFENEVKPDYCNVQGLEEFVDNEWCEWYSEDGSMDILEYMEEK